MIFKHFSALPSATQTRVAATLLTMTFTSNLVCNADVPLAQPTIERASSEVDANALALGGPGHGRTDYGQSINGMAFNDPIVSLRGWQYVVYYDAARHICLARRRLPTQTAPGSLWQTIRFSGYTFTTNDAHNTASVGISPKDGSIHIAYDGHGPPTYVRSSRPGVATDPENVIWSEELFGPQRNEIQEGKLLHVITYPRFFNSPDGDLQFAYREGGSGIGDLWMADYDAKTGKWGNSREIDSRNGLWHNGADPVPYTSRNSYPNGYQYGPDGRLHATWTWRETRAKTTSGNHDISYAYSDDKGITWKNNAGTVIARTAPGKAATSINIDSPGLIVVPVSIHQGLLNNQGQAIDNKGRVHVIMSYTTPESSRAAGLPWPNKATWGAVAALRYHHYFRQSDGTWKETELPWVAGGRGWMGFDKNDNAYFVYPGRIGAIPLEDKSDLYYVGSLTVATATAKNNYEDWHVAYIEQGPFLSEFRGDSARLKNESVLSLLAQRAAEHGVFSSSLSVVDLKIKP